MLAVRLDLYLSFFQWICLYLWQSCVWICDRVVFVFVFVTELCLYLYLWQSYVLEIQTHSCLLPSLGGTRINLLLWVGFSYFATLSTEKGAPATNWWWPCWSASSSVTYISNLWYISHVSWISVIYLKPVKYLICAGYLWTISEFLEFCFKHHRSSAVNTRCPITTNEYGAYWTVCLWEVERGGTSETQKLGQSGFDIWTSNSISSSFFLLFCNNNSLFQIELYVFWIGRSDEAEI